MNLSRIETGMIVEIKDNGYHAFCKVKSKAPQGKNITVEPFKIKSQDESEWGYTKHTGVGYQYMYYPNAVVARYTVEDFKEKYPEYLI
jgi:hypothetical protein